MSSRINPNLHPKGGFKYVDPDNVTHMADDLASLIQVVTHYRNRVGRPLGNPQVEIEDQLCQRHPALCRVADAARRSGTVSQIGTPTPEQTALAIHTAFNIKQAGRYPGKLLGLTEATARAETCRECSHAVDWTVGCSPCMRSVAGLTDAALAPLPVIRSTRNKACALAKDSLELAVWRDSVRKAKGAPAPCWRREELKPMGPPVSVK